MTYLRYVENLSLYNITSEPTEYIVQVNQDNHINHVAIYVSASFISLLSLCCIYYHRNKKRIARK